MKISSRFWKQLALLLTPALTLFGECECDDCGPFLSAQPKVTCPWGLYLTGEFIFWTAREEGLGFSSSHWHNELSSFETPSKVGSIKHPDFDFDPGFRVGMGYIFEHDCWDLFAQYTWFHIGDKNDILGHRNILTTENAGTWFIEDEVGEQNTYSSLVTDAETRWRLHFNAVDLELGRAFFVSRKLSFRPHFGLKGSWQNQNYDAAYLVLPLNILGQTRRKMEQELKYWGVGLRSGLQADWALNEWFSFLGRVAVSALWSGFEVDRRDEARDLSFNNSPWLTTFYTENSFHNIATVIELFFGLSWAKAFGNGCYFYRVDGGWEEQIWLGQNQFFRHFEEGAHGDLVLQGFTFRIRLDF